MLPVRLIPRLDIKGPNVVKGIHLEGLRVIGRPDKMARYYYEAGADELFFMDTVASLYERNSLGEIISKTASEIFIPLTVGGGMRTLHDMATALRAGADKVCLNTAAIKNPNIIKESSITVPSPKCAVAPSIENAFVCFGAGVCCAKLFPIIKKNSMLYIICFFIIS